MSGAKFTFVDTPEPHRERMRQIIKKHPEVKKLIGRNPWTFFFILLFGGIQTTVGSYLAITDAPIWVLLAVAFCFGAFLAHGLFVLIHDASHNLIFKNRWLNSFSILIANLSQAFPTGIAFQTYHLKHHFYQGIQELDADLPSPLEAKIFSPNFLTRIIWFFLFPLIQLSRLGKLTEIRVGTAWSIANFATQMAFDFAIYYFFGWEAVFYMVASFWFAVGLHPLGARWIQEHYMVNDHQETYSYYGPLNLVAFNVGYHNEHHDFPSVPWNRLPAIKKIAPEFYDTLQSHTSWFTLFFYYIFSGKLNCYSRTVRNNRGGVKHDDLEPDIAEFNKLQEQT